MKLDLGCGMNKQAGFVGVDSIAFEGVDIVTDLRLRWPWDDNSIEEAYAAHFLEHLTNLDGKLERVHFFNELYRVLIPGGKALIVIPHWASMRYYGDPSHKEPFSEFGIYYLSRDWRVTQKQAPHTDAENVPGMYSCDFDAVCGYNLHPQVQSRNPEYQSFAVANYKEAASDLFINLTKK